MPAQRKSSTGTADASPAGKSAPKATPKAAPKAAEARPEGRRTRGGRARRGRAGAAEAVEPVARGGRADEPGRAPGPWQGRPAVAARPAAARSPASTARPTPTATGPAAVPAERLPGPGLLPRGPIADGRRLRSLRRQPVAHRPAQDRAPQPGQAVLVDPEQVRAELVDEIRPRRRGQRVLPGVVESRQGRGRTRGRARRGRGPRCCRATGRRSRAGDRTRRRTRRCRPSPRRPVRRPAGAGR